MNEAADSVMTMLDGRDKIPLADVPRHIAKLTGAKPLARQTIWRWMKQGFPLQNGKTIRLPHFRVGRFVFTTAAAISQFIATATALATEPDDE